MPCMPEGLQQVSAGSTQTNTGPTAPSQRFSTNTYGGMVVGLFQERSDPHALGFKNQTTCGCTKDSFQCFRHEMCCQRHYREEEGFMYSEGAEQGAVWD